MTLAAIAMDGDTALERLNVAEQKLMEEYCMIEKLKRYVIKTILV